MKMAHVCTRSSAFFSRNSLPRPVVSRSAAYSRRARPVRASAQNGDLFFVTNNVFKVRSLPINISQHTSPHNGRASHYDQPCIQQVKQEGCQQFEETWKNRESRLKDTPGFLRFALLRGDEEGMYVSQHIAVPCNFKT